MTSSTERLHDPLFDRSPSMTTWLIPEGRTANSSVQRFVAGPVVQAGLYSTFSSDTVTTRTSGRSVVEVEFVGRHAAPLARLDLGGGCEGVPGELSAHRSLLFE